MTFDDQLLFRSAFDPWHEMLLRALQNESRESWCDEVIIQVACPMIRKPTIDQGNLKSKYFQVMTKRPMSLRPKQLNAWCGQTIKKWNGTWSKDYSSHAELKGSVAYHIMSS